MKGGRRIDDHEFMGFKPKKGECCPDHVIIKDFEPAMGSGDVRNYQDDQKAIKDAQNNNDRMIDKQRQKEDMR